VFWAEQLLVLLKYRDFLFIAVFELNNYLLFLTLQTDLLRQMLRPVGNSRFYSHTEFYTRFSGDTLFWAELFLSINNRFPSEEAQIFIAYWTFIPFLH
jgi:hypothetical protein